MKIGFFITARLKSSRLKHKILLDLNGKSVIDRVIERCKSTQGVDGVVLCTSTNPQDSLLYKNALSNKIQFFPGSEVDVLDRLLSAAQYFGYDAFVSITADNPLFSVYTSQLVIDNFKRNGHDFIFTKGLPIGVSTYFLTTKALQIANFMKKESDTEIWGSFVNRRDFFDIGELEITNSPFDESKRITCDYPEDYSLIRTLYSYFSSNYRPTMFEIFDLLKTNNDLWEINKKYKQMGLSTGLLKKINESFERNKEKGISFAEEIGKKLNPGFQNYKVEI